VCDGGVDCCELANGLVVPGHGMGDTAAGSMVKEASWALLQEIMVQVTAPQSCKARYARLDLYSPSQLIDDLG